MFYLLEGKSVNGDGRNKEVNCEGSKEVKEFITVYKEEFCSLGQKHGNKCSPKLALKMIVFYQKRAITLFNKLALSHSLSQCTPGAKKISAFGLDIQLIWP